MKKSICITLSCLFLFSLTGQAQTTAEYRAAQARSDFRNETPKLMLIPGSVTQKDDKLFQQRYGVQYVAPGYAKADLIAYNYTMFDQLNGLYMRQWQEEVREDVVGYKKWLLYQDAVPYEKADVKPTFQGGTVNDFNLWAVIKMGLDAEKPGEDYVQLNMLLDEEGKIIDIDTFGAENPTMDAFMEIAKNAPDWTPGSCDGQACRTIIPVKISARYRADARE